jgi:O-antigen/teichoic acid export membrane protein
VGWSGAYLLVSRLAAVAAVPILLSALGSDLYAAWVLAGTLLMAQGLADLGMGAALTRFVADSAARGFGEGARAAAARGVLFFAGLGVAGGLLLALLAEPISGADAFGSHSADAAVLLRYSAAAFLVSNLTMSVAATLQGLNRVDVSYRAQTLGWLTYVPVLALAMAIGSDVHGAGVAWLATYGTQLALLLPSCLRALRALPKGEGTVPRLLNMISFGGRWQISSWADFATFQLPRILGALLLTSSAVVSIDLALRFAQAVVTPLFAVFPILLPAFSRIWAATGASGLRDALRGWYRRGLGMLLLGGAVTLPLSVPAIATWTGRSVEQVDAVVCTAILVGMLAHSSTGLFSNAWLAVGELRAVIVYKAWQLGLAGLFVPIGALLGPRELAIALGLSLAAPAFLFNRSSTVAFGLERVVLVSSYGGRLALAVTGSFLVTLVVVETLSRSAPAWVALAVGTATATTAWLLGVRLCDLGPLHAPHLRRGRRPDAPQPSTVASKLD